MNLYDYIFEEDASDDVAIRMIATSDEYKSLMSITYNELKDKIESTRKTLVSKYEVVSRDVVAICLDNSIENIIVTLACIKNNCIVVPINPKLSDEDINYQLNTSKCKLSISSGRLLMSIHIDDIIDNGMIKDHSIDTKIPLETSINDVCMIVFSSGTTGVSKGVQLTHGNLISNLKQMNGFVNPEYKKNVLSMLPQYHIYCIQVITNLTLKNKGCINIMQGYSIENLKTSIESYMLDVLYVVPSVIVDIVKYGSKIKFNTGTYILSGASVLNASIAQEFTYFYQNVTLVQAYGMTEASPVVTVGLPGQDPCSVGSIVPDTHIMIDCVGEDGIGELCFRGPQIMKGYLQNGAKHHSDNANEVKHHSTGTNEQSMNEASLHSDNVNEASLHSTYYRTGDLGYMKNGLIYITGRCKDLIKYKGYQVSPTELESKLLEFDCIKDVCVIGPIDKNGEETVVACIVSDKSDEVIESIKYLNSKLTFYKRIRHHIITDLIIKSPSGKILRNKMVEMYMNSVSKQNLDNKSREWTLSIPDNHVYIESIETSVPDNEYDIEEYCDLYKAHVLKYNSNFDSTKLLDRLKNGGGIKKKYSILDLRCEVPSCIKTKNEVCWTEGLKLIDKCLSKMNLQGITHVVSSTSTIFGAPGLDAHIISKYDLHPGCKRLSIQQMGCTGGGALLDTCISIAKGNPKARVLGVVIDTCIPYFFNSNSEPSDIVSSYLFSDGCAAFICSCSPDRTKCDLDELKLHSDDTLNDAKHHSGHNPLKKANIPSNIMKYISSGSYTAPETLDAMNIKINSETIVPGLSRTIDKQIVGIIDNLLVEGGYQSGDKLLFHPGGKSILNALDDKFGMKSIESWHVLEQYGNMSGPTLLFVIKECLESGYKGTITCCCFGQGLYTECLRFEV